jgi:hypothetical protein
MLKKSEVDFQDGFEECHCFLNYDHDYYPEMMHDIAVNFFGKLER